jgi:hypothetical protein
MNVTKTAWKPTRAGIGQKTAPAFSAFTTSVWLPEVLALFELDSVTLEKLLVAYGSPQAIAADTLWGTSAEQAAKNMKAWGGHFLKTDKIVQVIDSAINTIGQPCIDAVYALRVSAVTCKPWRPKCSTAVAKAKPPNSSWKPVSWPMKG